MDNIYQEILTAIKTDNLQDFSKHIQQKKGYLALCYGRFPILSICYLYKSQKIIKEHQKALSQVTTYIYIDEDFDIYKKFKDYAKRALRLYVLEKNIVSPLEVLAIMEESIYLTDIYPKIQKNKNITDNISKIYRINHNQTIEQNNEKIYIKRKKLTKLQRIWTITAVAVACIIIILSSAFWVTFNTVYGSGTKDNPFAVCSEKQLAKAIEKGTNNYKLTKDITLKSTWNISNFSGTLNGQGHTIYANEKVKTGFIKNLTGKIENINFVFNTLSLKINANSALIINTNEGTINNVTVSVKKGVFTETSVDDESVYMSCLVYKNNGNILNCTVDADINFSSNGKNDTFFSGIAAINNGNVIDCITTEKSKFITDTVDLAGIVTENAEKGVISGCANNAQIKQQSANENWLPNTSGVALINSGEVVDCFNYGSISSISVATDAENILNVYAGGIVCINNNKIAKCKNKGNIIALSNNFNIYVGGVVAVNNDIYAIVNNCCSYGEINVDFQNPENVFLLCGGISAFNAGYIKDCYSVSDYQIQDEMEANFIGGITGTAVIYSASLENNFYTKNSVIEYGTASMIFQNSIYKGEANNQGTTEVADLNELKNKEVYWG